MKKYNEGKLGSSIVMGVVLAIFWAFVMYVVLLGITGCDVADIPEQTNEDSESGGDDTQAAYTEQYEAVYTLSKCNEAVEKLKAELDWVYAEYWICDEAQQ